MRKYAKAVDYLQSLLSSVLSSFGILSGVNLIFHPSIGTLIIIGILLLFILFILYTAFAVRGMKKLIIANLKNVMPLILKLSESFFPPNYRFRVNVFMQDRDKKLRIKYQLHMEQHSDLSIELAENVGVTGSVWHSKNQQLCDVQLSKSMGAGAWGIPPEEMAKVDANMKWIVSTPILDEKNNVFAVINFDSTENIDPEFIEKVKEKARQMASALGAIIP